MVAGDEVVEVGALEGVFLEREMQVGAQVVDPELPRPRLFLRGLAVEEEDVRLHALRVEDAGGQAQQGVDVGLLEQFAPDGFARAAFEEDVVRQHDRRAAVLLEDGEDVLEEIELLVARARPEIVAVDDERFLGRLARLVDDGDAALLAEGRIGQDDLVFAVLPGQRVLGDDGQVSPPTPPPMPCSSRFIAQRRVTLSTSSMPKNVPLLSFFFCARSSCVMLGEVIMRREQEAARAARRIADGLPRLRGDRRPPSRR